MGYRLYRPFARLCPSPPSDEFKGRTASNSKLKMVDIFIVGSTAPLLSQRSAACKLGAVASLESFSKQLSGAKPHKTKRFSTSWTEHTGLRWKSKTKSTWPRPSQRWRTRTASTGRFICKSLVVGILTRKLIQSDNST